MPDNGTYPEIEHGSYGGYQQELKLGFPTCQSCREARSDYMRQYRERHPHSVDNDVLRSRAWAEANRRLREAHRAEWRRYYAEARG